MTKPERDRWRQELLEAQGRLLDCVATAEASLLSIEQMLGELAADAVASGEPSDALPVRLCAYGVEVAAPPVELEHIAQQVAGAGEKPYSVDALIGFGCQECDDRHPVPVEFKPAGRSASGALLLWDGRTLPGVN